MADIITGKNPVLEALKAGRPLNRVLVDREARHHTVNEIIKLARDRKVPVDFVDRHTLDRQAPDAKNQGVLAYTSSKAYTDLDDLLAAPQEKHKTSLFLVLDGIEDPQNLGAIVRTAEATGVNGIIIRSRRAGGLTPAVAKASAGAIAYVPIARVANIAQAIETLKKHGVWVVGIDMHGKAAYTGVDFKLPTAIVVGGEDKGLSALVRERCDVTAFIPMKGKVGSLNASVAAAVVLYEALKQRGR